MLNFKKAIVITGSIGCGKSTISNILKLHGYKIVDADEIAHKILDDNKDKISQKFGLDFVNKNGVDRRKLRDIIFADEINRKWLENLLHKPIKDEILRLASELEKQGIWYFIEIPLYFENGNYMEFDQVVVVYAPNDILVDRICQRDSLSKIDAQRILNLQEDIESKRQKANFVIDNSKDLKWLNSQIENFIQRLENESF